MKKIIDILGILLPALILLLGLLRLFSNNRKGHNALTMLFTVLLLLAGLIRFFVFPGGSVSNPADPKQTPVSVSKHSEAFNQSLEDVLNNYYKMTDGFVKNDTAVINQSGMLLKMAIDSFKVEELKRDSLIYVTALQPLENIKSEIVSILADPEMEEKKGSLNIFSNELFNLVNTVHYDLAKLYWLECPSAFGEDRPGNWLSPVEKSMNPYGVKDCADVKTSIDFVVVDSTKK